MTFKLLTLDTLEVIILNDDVILVVIKCERHDEAFA